MKGEPTPKQLEDGLVAARSRLAHILQLDKTWEELSPTDQELASLAVLLGEVLTP